MGTELFSEAARSIIKEQHKDNPLLRDAVLKFMNDHYADGTPIEAAPEPRKSAAPKEPVIDEVAIGRRVREILRTRPNADPDAARRLALYEASAVGVTVEPEQSDWNPGEAGDRFDELRGSLLREPNASEAKFRAGIGRITSDALTGVE